MAVALLPQTDSQPALPAYFTWGMARDQGISRGDLNKLLANRLVRRVFKDVYVRSRVPDTLDSRLEAARLILPPHAVVVDRTAAWIWGVDILDHWELEFLPRLDVFVLRGNKRITRDRLGGGTRDLSSRDIVHVDGVTITTPLRTALDLGCGLRRYNALAAMDALAHEQGVTREDLEREVPRFRGRRGVVQTRTLTPLVDGRTESPGESFAKLAIVESGLPLPEPQYWVELDGVPIYRLDLAYPRLKICIEYDGEQYHSSDEDKEADQRRRRWLRDQGWYVVVVDKGSFNSAAREDWLAELGRVFRERASTKSVRSRSR